MFEIHQLFSRPLVWDEEQNTGQLANKIKFPQKGFINDVMQKRNKIMKLIPT